jgi:hypothetical protein
VAVEQYATVVVVVALKLVFDERRPGFLSRYYKLGNLLADQPVQLELREIAYMPDS